MASMLSCLTSCPRLKAQALLACRYLSYLAIEAMWTRAGFTLIDWSKTVVGSVFIHVVKFVLLWTHLRVAHKCPDYSAALLNVHPYVQVGLFYLHMYILLSSGIYLDLLR